MKVEVEAQLAKLEQAANPWWSTFCGITNGVWLGETAAFAPSTGELQCHTVKVGGLPCICQQIVVCCSLALQSVW